MISGTNFIDLNKKNKTKQKKNRQIIKQAKSYSHKITY